ncbi:MAG: hypothetical protein A2341_23465 [Deltaproteobacteria bacterium RIFOXYB12_FULL_58_9]|nr:MAG: hypothetical protein A2341_23465 [Deltaproteobacteria bacterium RIFOXYB12_FULL_58_9]
MILLNPGPANTTDTVKRAMTKPDICPREQEFGKVMLRVRDGLARVVDKSGDFTAVLFLGSGTAGVEAAVSSTVPHHGRLLVIDNGSYGARIAEMARAYGIAHDVEEFGVGGFPNVGQIKDRLAKTQYTHLAVIHHETSTGMLNPVREIGAVCREKGVEMIVDAMSSYAAMPIDMADLGADYLVSTSNKCIQGMAGLTFVICRKTTLARLQPITGRSLYLNLPEQHRFFAKSQQMRYTPPVQIIYALEQALTEYEAEGAEGRHRRYMECFTALDSGMGELGFRRLLPPAQMSRILTAYIEPDHPSYSFNGMHDRLFSKGFTIYPGKGANKATFRLANMGAITPQDMTDFIGAMRETIHEMAMLPLYAS